MVMSGFPEELHPIEQAVASHLQSGLEITIESMGGIEAVVASADALGASRFQPEILRALVDCWKESLPTQGEHFQAAFAKLLAGNANDFTLTETIDLLDAYRPLPGKGDEICFSSFLAKAQDLSLPALTRGIAAEGSFRWAVSNRRWQLRLLDFLLGVSVTEAPEFVRRIAKLSGIAHAHWRESELLGKLTEFTESAEAVTDAAFELGIASLIDGIDADGPGAALSSFERAKDWFEKSLSHSEVNPEAQLFLECLNLITAYQSTADREILADTLNRISTTAFELSAWFDTQDSPSWLGTRRLETVYWNQLALAIGGLLDHLEEACWWEPAAVIEQHVLAVYSANRSILRRGPDGNINALLRPRIVASLARYRGQAHQLKTWLNKNLSHEWAAEAQHLLTEVERTASGTDLPVNPSDAAVEQPSIAALIDKMHLPESTKNTLLQVVGNAISVHVDNLTGAEIDIIEDAVKTAGQHPDYQNNPHAHRLFDAVLMWVVRFLFNRLEMTKADDPTVEYLFQRAHGTNVKEDALQDDFFRWLTTNAAGSDLEPTNLGGGRADIKLKSSSERVVIEVKRELEDSSFDALAISHQAQATDYQNVSVRLGFLLVLDVANNNNEGTPHIRSLVQTRLVQRTGEDHPRLLVIVKVPGNRKRPSDLTKAAKATRGR
jgi:hypothetical protein